MDEIKFADRTARYELTFVVNENDKAEPIEKIIGDLASKLLKTIDLGTKQFAYPIKKLNIGHYFVVAFEASPESLKEINKQLKHEQSILRYLVVKSLRFPEKRAPKPLETTKIEEKKAAVEEEKKEIVRPLVKPKAAEKEAVKQEVEEKEEEKIVLKTVKKKKKVAEKISSQELDKKLEELVED